MAQRNGAPAKKAPRAPASPNTISDADWARIEAATEVELRNMPRLGANERDVVDSFLIQYQGGQFDDRLPLTAECRVVTEMAFRFGRADIVVFHSDGSASIIEAKDGAKGYSHVVAGIGQAGLYAAQLAMSRGTISKVRRALLWSSTGNLFLDALIETVCEQAGVVALPTASARRLKASRAAVQAVLAGA